MSALLDRQESEHVVPPVDNLLSALQREPATPAELAKPKEGPLRELLRIAVPLILSSGSLSIMHVVDRIFMTWYSVDAMGAALVAGAIEWTALVLGILTCGYATTFVAQYEGANRPQRVRDTIWHSAIIAIALGIISLVMVPIAPSLFRLLDHAPRIQRYEVIYFQTLCFGILPSCLECVLASFYSGRGKTLVVLGVNLVGMGIDIVLDYWFIFGGLGLPPMGIVGAALSTNLGSASMVILYLVIMAYSKDGRDYQLFRMPKFDSNLLGRLIWYGVPNGLYGMMELLSFTLFIIMIGNLGPAALSATSLAFNLNTLSFVPIMGLGQALMTIVGKRVGEKEPRQAIRSTWLAYALANAYVVGFSVVFLAFPSILLLPYSWTEDLATFEQIKPITIVLLRFVAVFIFFDNCCVVFGSAIRGAGDTQYCMKCTMLVGAFVMVLPTFIATRYFDASVYVGWWFATLYILVLAILFCRRFLSGKWIEMSVIESSPLAD